MDLMRRPGLLLLVDLGVVPVPPLLGVVWVEVHHDDHAGLQLVPLVDCAGARPDVLGQQLDHAVLWIAEVKEDRQCAAHTHTLDERLDRHHGLNFCHRLRKLNYKFG